MNDDDKESNALKPPTSTSVSKTDPHKDETRVSRIANSPKTPVDEVKHKSKRLILVLILLLMVMLVGLGLYFSESGSDVTKGSLDKDASEKQNAISIERPLSIDIPGYPKMIALEADSSQSYIDLYNPDTNKAYLTFEIVIGDTKDGQFIQKDVLYKSELIAPGFSVDKQTLSHALAVGQYDAAINIQAYSYDPKTETTMELNGAQNTLQFKVVHSQ